jgi:hypothetical protein
MFNGIGGYEAVYLAIVILALVLSKVTKCLEPLKNIFNYKSRDPCKDGSISNAGPLFVVGV